MKYEEKRAEIRAYLEQTHFPGKKIPTERELAALFEMNLGMVREVLRELETLGIIRKHTRQGNFLNTSVLQARQRIDDNCSFLALIQEQGYTVSEQKRLRQRPLEEHDAVAQELLGRSREELLCFEELYLADGEPALLSFFYSPASHFGPVDWDAICEDSAALQQQIREKTYGDYDHSVIRLLPVIAGKETAAKLGIEPGAPVELWKELYYNTYDELTQVSFNYLNPRYMELTFIRKRPASSNSKE